MTDHSALDVVVRAIGWALLHSVWQGTLIAGITALLLLALRQSAAAARYLVACLGLSTILMTGVATAVHVSRTTSTTRQTREIDDAVPPVVVEPRPAGSPAATPAIQPLRSLDALTDLPQTTWRQRLDAWSVTLVPVWLLGVLVLSIRLALGWVVVQRLRRAALSPPSAALRASVAALAGRLRISRMVRVAQSAVVQVPTVIGWLRPIVLLPARVLTGLTREQLEAVLAHELAHIRRHDYAVNVLQNAAEILLFYHPACWWLSRRIRVAREQSCDDVAVALCGDPIVYATALADLESLRTRPALALAATDGPLLQRVRRLISSVPEERAASGWVAATVLLAIITLLAVGLRAARVAAVDAGAAQISRPGGARLIPADEGMIEGRVVDGSSGRPVPGAAVEIEGSRGLTTATTNTDGRYEATSLMPGSYRVTVNAEGYVEGHYGAGGALLISAAPIDLGTTVEVRGGHLAGDIDIRLDRAGSINGRITDARGRGLAGVEVELWAERRLPEGSGSVPVAFAQTMTDGSYRIGEVAPGDYYVRSYTSRKAEPGTPSALAYAPTYYPNVPNVDEAQPLRLYAGQELLDIDVALTTTRRVRVSGRLVDPTGPVPQSVHVRLDGVGSRGAGTEVSSSVVDGEGRFAIPDVVPGDYMLTVLDPRGTPRWLSSVQPVRVDTDIAGLEVRASTTTRVEGRIVRDARATTALDVTKVQVSLELHLAGPWSSVVWGAGAAAVDGSFSMESPAGPVSVKVTNVPAGWMVKSISLDGTELNDGPVDFGIGIRQVDVVLTDNVSGVSGVVVDRTGRALANYSVVIFARDPSRWHASSRFVLAARSNNEGQFRIEAVPPDEYLAVAVPASSGNAWINPDVLARLQTGAEPLRIGEGERLTISISASPIPDFVGAR